MSATNFAKDFRTKDLVIWNRIIHISLGWYSCHFDQLMTSQMIPIEKDLHRIPWKAICAKLAHFMDQVSSPRFDQLTCKRLHLFRVKSQAACTHERSSLSLMNDLVYHSWFYFHIILLLSHPLLLKFVLCLYIPPWIKLKVKDYRLSKGRGSASQQISFVSGTKCRGCDA